VLQNRVATEVQPRRLAAATEARPKRRTPQEAHRYNGNSPEAHRIRKLTAKFTMQLGEAAASDPIIKEQIARAAELVMLSEKARAQAIRGESIDPLAFVRLEGLASRAVRLLFDLRDISKREPEPEKTLADYMRGLGSEAPGKAGQRSPERFPPLTPSRPKNKRTRRTQAAVRPPKGKGGSG
jgi:hypothetical protein